MMKRESQAFGQLRTATIRLQAQWRMIKMRRNYASCRKSAIVIQKNVRCWLAVTSYRRLLKARRLQRELELSSTIKIQAWYRSILIGRDTREQYKRQRDLIVRLQSRVRGKLQRSRYLELKSCTIRLQAMARMKRDQKRYTAMRQSCAVIQSWYRACREAKAARGIFLKKQRAAIVIQAHVRRVQAERRFAETKRVVVLAQAHVRRFLAQRKLEKLRWAAILAQRTFRQRLLVKADRDKFLEMREAAVRIQVLIEKIDIFGILLCHG